MDHATGYKGICATLGRNFKINNAPQGTASNVKSAQYRHLEFLDSLWPARAPIEYIKNAAQKQFLFR